MTREEAIQALNEIFDDSEFSRYESWYGTAMDMAIEALSKPNYETDTEVRLTVTNRKKEKVILLDAFGEVEYVPSADAVQGEWIPCSEKMPKELERLNVTWLNHNPPFYYQHIKDIPLTDTAVYYRGKWYWWDVTVIDALAEYGEDCNAEQIDKDIEVVAWMPLPKPYKGGND